MRCADSGYPIDLKIFFLGGQYFRFIHRLGYATTSSKKRQVKVSRRYLGILPQRQKSGCRTCCLVHHAHEPGDGSRTLYSRTNQGLSTVSRIAAIHSTPSAVFSENNFSIRGFMLRGLSISYSNCETIIVCPVHLDTRPGQRFPILRRELVLDA
jgi:hypothetical protein